MAISLANLRRATAFKPPRLLFYSEPGMGKTTLASEFPDHVFLQIEDGTPADAEITSFGELNDYADVMSALGALYMEDHAFKWVVIDSVTYLQKLVFAETCARGDDKGNAKAHIEDFGYGKGYVYCQRVWEDFLTGLRALRNDRNMGIVLIAHSIVERFDDPETVSYDRYEIDLHAKSVGMIEREVDGILLLKKPVHIQTEKQGFDGKRAIAQGSSNRIQICAQGKPAYIAKNRYGIPETLDFVRGKGYAALSQYFPQPLTPATPDLRQAAE